MLKWGSCNFDDFKKLRDNIEKLGNQRQQFCEDCARELAARLLSLVIPHTPVGKKETRVVRDEVGNAVKLKSGTNKGKNKKQVTYMGGTLRRGWTAKTEDEAAGGRGRSSASAGASYAKILPVDRIGDNYQITVINPVHYASYVEFGHRTASGKGWVKGKYMLTISEKQLRQWMSGHLEKQLQTFLKKAFEGL